MVTNVTKRRATTTNGGGWGANKVLYGETCRVITAGDN